MDPHTRMAASLVLSLIVSANNLKMAAMGEADIVDVGLRYVAAFLVAFVIVGVVGTTINGYIRIHEAEDTDDDEAVDRRADGGALEMPV